MLTWTKVYLNRVLSAVTFKIATQIDIQNGWFLQSFIFSPFSITLITDLIFQKKTDISLADFYSVISYDKKLEMLLPYGDTPLVSSCRGQGTSFVKNQYKRDKYQGKMMSV